MNLRDTVVDAVSRYRRAALLVAGAGAAALGLALGYKYLLRPEKRVRVGVVAQIFIHPLKSGKAQPVARADVHKMGLRSGDAQDRHWLLVTDDGHMVTARQEPRLVLVSLTCHGGQVVLNGPDMEELRFPVRQPGNRVVDCRVFGADVQGRDCGEEASRWFARYLGPEKPLRLVHYEPHMKPRRSADSEPVFPRTETVAYPDVAPVMLLSAASVEDLSSRMEKPVTVERFRPNIVISECEPFAEDSWEELQIGSVRLRRVMSCGRCLLTTVDPETGIISRKEPLDTLKSYRQCDPAQKHIYKASPLFGQLHAVKQTGALQVGDEVYQISR
ncbi:mitochondrial amidoxime-reducing component 1 [Betta splendens]|uniref:Mitochondrial amidoxime-reducing component 1 n=1 Tax=Betta splendens TaxID=158456 RepID=A0A6P7LL85_BETSP|nr:mitochondrial amidoxime-reducing component 1 [Betta splendens]